MEVTPDEYHARRAIMRSVADRSMKTVNLEIQKGDESTIIKIETSALRCMDDSYYNPWRMEGIFSPKTNTTLTQLHAMSLRFTAELLTHIRNLICHKLH